jgi:hypothetical protein
MNRAPSVAYEGAGADALGAALSGAVEGAADDDDAAEGAAELPPALHAAMKAAMLVNPVAARNLRRVISFADTRRTMASIS